MDYDRHYKRCSYAPSATLDVNETSVDCRVIRFCLGLLFECFEQESRSDTTNMWKYYPQMFWSVKSVDFCDISLRGCYGRNSLTMPDEYERELGLYEGEKGMYLLLACLIFFGFFVVFPCIVLCTSKRSLKNKLKSKACGKSGPEQTAEHITDRFDHGKQEELANYLSVTPLDEINFDATPISSTKSTTSSGYTTDSFLEW